MNPTPDFTDISDLAATVPESVQTITERCIDICDKLISAVLPALEAKRPSEIAFSFYDNHKTYDIRIAFCQTPNVGYMGRYALGMKAGNKPNYSYAASYAYGFCAGNRTGSDWWSVDQTERFLNNLPTIKAQIFAILEQETDKLRQVEVVANRAARKYKRGEYEVAAQDLTNYADKAKAEPKKG